MMENCRIELKAHLYTNINTIFNLIEYLFIFQYYTEETSRQNYSNCYVFIYKKRNLCISLSLVQLN